MPKKKPKINMGLPPPINLPPPNKNMYKRKSNKILPNPHRLPTPFKNYSSKKLLSLPSTYNYDNMSLPKTYSNNGLLKRDVFPSDKITTTFRTRELVPSPNFPVVAPPNNKQIRTGKRCKRGTRRNKKTKLCEKNNFYMRKTYNKRYYKRCPNGKWRNPITLNCESKNLFTRYRV